MALAVIRLLAIAALSLQLSTLLGKAGKVKKLELGILFPAETVRHERTFLSFPGSSEIWTDLKEVQREVVKIAEAIVAFEPVTVIVSPKDAVKASKMLSPKIDIMKLPVEDLWARDIVPIFTIDREKTENRKGETSYEESLIGVDFNFNGWGKKQVSEADSELAEKLLWRMKVRRQISSLVAEGGSFETDGDGTLLLTESSVIHKNRNAGKSKKVIEEELKNVLGVKKIIWFKGVAGEDITDAHVDSIVRFVRPGRVIITQPPNAEVDVKKGADGKKGKNDDTKGKKQIKKDVEDDEEDEDDETDVKKKSNKNDENDFKKGKKRSKEERIGWGQTRRKRASDDAKKKKKPAKSDEDDNEDEEEPPKKKDADDDEEGEGEEDEADKEKDDAKEEENDDNGSDEEDVWTKAAAEAYRVLKNATDARGRHFDIVELHEPDPNKIKIVGKKSKFVSTYVNFYVVNGAVIMPKFGHKAADDAAQKVLSEEFPSRKIVAIEISALASGGGGIHCATHELPAIKAKNQSSRNSILPIEILLTITILAYLLV